LITGGAGFIGSHLAKYLRGRAEIRVLDNLRSSKRSNLDGASVDFIDASVLDTAALRRATAGVDIVFHLGAMVSVKESMERPKECVEINAIGTLNVLRASADSNVRRLVFASSAAIYGDDPPCPTAETAAPAPRSPYAVTKWDGECYCEMFSREGWLSTASLRFFNVFGPLQDPGGAYAAAVPGFLRCALRGEPLTIFGDGEQSRDFIYVKDVVSALVFVSENEKAVGVYNCGYGERMTINALARKILALAPSGSTIVHRPPRPGDVRHSCASVDKLSALGWAPANGLAEGLKETFDALRG
jgi:UDP-glucose 4-epimerase